MAQYKLKTPEFLERHVVGTYHKIEDGVVGAYKKIETKFVDTFLEPAAEKAPQEENRTDK